jgi:hypothetical protein
MKVDILQQMPQIQKDQKRLLGTILYQKMIKIVEEIVVSSGTYSLSYQD